MGVNDTAMFLHPYSHTPTLPYMAVRGKQGFTGNTTMKKHAFFTLVAVLMMPMVVRGADSIVAFVGNKAVLASEVTQKMRELNVSKVEAMSSLLQEKLLLAEADILKIKVPDDEVQAEVNRMIREYPSRDEFRKQLQKEGLPYDTFKSKIEERLRARKVIAEKVGKQVTASSSDIMKAIKELKKESIEEYHLLTQSFSDKASAETFIAGWTAANEKEMTDIGWARESEYLPAIVEAISHVKAQQLTQPVPIGEKWHLFYVKEQRKKEIPPDQLHTMAREKILQQRYEAKMRELFKELQQKIPIKIVQE